MPLAQRESCVVPNKKPMVHHMSLLKTLIPTYNCNSKLWLPSNLDEVACQLRRRLGTISYN